MKSRQFPRDVQLMAYVQKADAFAVRGVEKRHLVPAKIQGICDDTLRIPLSLPEYFLGTNGKLFPFDYPENFSADT
jgi:hypothetical protein